MLNAVLATIDAENVNAKKHCPTCDQPSTEIAETYRRQRPGEEWATITRYRCQNRTCGHRKFRNDRLKRTTWEVSE